MKGRPNYSRELVLKRTHSPRARRLIPHFWFLQTYIQSIRSRSTFAQVFGRKKVVLLPTQRKEK
jgi:hypothetical protein